MLDRADVMSVVLDNLRYIRDEWGENISDGALRRGSTVLRLLLVQNELQRAWKAAGFEREPLVHAAGLSHLAPGDLRFASAGGARYNGVTLQGVVETQPGAGPRVNAAMLALLNRSPDRSEMPAEPLPLSKFIGAPCLVVEGIPIARRVVVNYIANKLGGAHFDTKRDADRDAVYRVLDRIDVQVSEKPAVYFELLAMGQALVASADVQRLMALPMSA